jgi:hypothetical protein
MSINNYSLKGLSSSVQYGKNGGIFDWDCNNNYFSLRSNASQYSKILLNNILLEEESTTPNSITGFATLYSLNDSNLYVKFSNNTVHNLTGTVNFNDLNNNPLSTSGNNIYTSQNFGIGNTNPQSTLHVTNSNTNSNSNILRLETKSTSDNTTEFIEFYDTDTIQGKITGDSGNAIVYSTTSDKRLKYDIKNTEINGTEIINKIKVRDFKWKKGNNKDIGLIAQELKEVYPLAVFGDESKDFLTIEKQSLVPLLIKTLQEVIDRNNKLSKENNSLNERIKKIEEALF